MLRTGRLSVDANIKKREWGLKWSLEGPHNFMGLQFGIILLPRIMEKVLPDRYDWSQLIVQGMIRESGDQLCQKFKSTSTAEFPESTEECH